MNGAPPRASGFAALTGAVHAVHAVHAAHAPRSADGVDPDRERRCGEAAARLRRVVRGIVSTRTSVLVAHSTDAGRAVHRTPGVVVLATCEDDVCATLATARALELSVAVRGRGHSVNGQTLSDGGIVIASGVEAGAIAEHLGDGLFVVSARARWLDVERAMNRLDWSVPVHADYLGLSVGGTVSVGCYGERSIRSGGLIDWVRRVRLVLPDGTARWCSPNQDVALYRFALAGLGQVGVIERVVVQGVRLQRAALIHTHRTHALGAMLREIEWLADDGMAAPDTLPDTFMGTRFQLFARGRFDTRWTTGMLASTRRSARRTTLASADRVRAPDRRELYATYFASRSRMVGLWDALSRGAWRVWTDYVLDFNGARQLIDLIEGQYRAGEYEGCATSTYLVAIRRPPGALDLPLAPANQTDGSLRMGVGVFSFVPRGDSTRLERVRRAASRCLESCIALGGRPYLYGWHDLDAASARRVYGDALDELRALRATLDPSGLFHGGKLPGL